MKASNTQRESRKFSDDPGRLGEKSDGIQKKHREKAGEHRKNLVIFRKYQEKEKALKKAGEHQKREVLFSSTEKRWRASGKSGEAKEKSGVSFTTPEKGEELPEKLVNTGRRRSSGTTPRKCGTLPEKLVKSEKTPEKDGETPEKRGEPVKYYRNNLDTTLTLLEVMKEYDVKRILFSSSATVYGNEHPVPFTETMERGKCTNPYGWTKSMIEQILSDTAAAIPECRWCCSVILILSAPMRAD